MEREGSGLGDATGRAWGRFDGVITCACGRTHWVAWISGAHSAGDGSEGREASSGETDGGGAVGGGTEGSSGPVGQTPWNDIMTPAATAARLKQQAALARWGKR